MKGRSRPIIISALVIALLMSVQSIVSYTLESRRVESLMKHEMDDAENALYFSLIKVYDAAEEMVRLTLSSLDDPDEMYSLADRVLQKYSDLSNCYISFVPDFFPQKGRLYAPSAYWEGNSVIVHSQFGADLDYTERSWYKGAMNGDSDGFWSSVYIDSDINKPVITHSVKVLFPDGETIGVVGVDLEAEWLKLTMEGCRPDDNITCRLYNADGELLMEAGPEVKESLIDKHLILETTLSPIDVRLIISVPESAIWKKVGMNSLFTFFILLGCMSLLGFLVMRYLRNQKALAKAEMEQELTRKEMLFAHKIQMDMLPRQDCQRDDVVVRGSLVPAREVGGDIYDYFIRDEKLFFCVGDVSGKGASSAMLMGVTHALFRSASTHESNPARIMRSINETACLGNEANMFVTLYIGVLDLPTGRLMYCSAGHDSPLVADAGGMRVEECLPHLPVGVFDDVQYSAQETLVAPGSTIFLYTDGLTEAMNTERRQFGLQRVREVLGKCVERQSGAEQILETMGSAVREFAGGADQSDDLTMLAIRYTPRQYESSMTRTLVLKNDVREVSRLSCFLKTALADYGVADQLAKRLRLAVEEAVVNVIEYAYPDGTEGTVELTLMSDGNSLKVTLVDSGGYFDPTAREMTDTNLSAEDRQLGGLGLLLVRELMDTINYERINEKNILTLSKQLK